MLDQALSESMQTQGGDSGASTPPRGTSCKSGKERLPPKVREPPLRGLCDDASEDVSSKSRDATLTITLQEKLERDDDAFCTALKGLVGAAAEDVDVYVLDFADYATRPKVIVSLPTEVETALNPINDLDARNDLNARVTEAYAAALARAADAAEAASEDDVRCEACGGRHVLHTCVEGMQARAAALAAAKVARAARAAEAASEDDVRCKACRGHHVRHTCGKGRNGRPKKGAAKAKGGAAAAHSTKKPRQGIPVSGEDAKTEPAAGCPPGMTDAHYSDLFNTTIKEGTHPHDPSKNTHAFPELLQGGSAERGPAPASAERGLAPVASESMETAEAQFVFGDRRAKTSRSRDEDGDDDPPPDGCDESGSGQIPK